MAHRYRRAHCGMQGGNIGEGGGGGNIGEGRKEGEAGIATGARGKRRGAGERLAQLTVD